MDFTVFHFTGFKRLRPRSYYFSFFPVSPAGGSPALIQYIFENNLSHASPSCNAVGKPLATEGSRYGRAGKKGAFCII